MKKIKTLLAAALMMFSASAFAQATYEAADGTKYEFKKHAFLNLEAGAQYTLGEAKFKDLISPNVQLGLGYQFTPVFGARIRQMPGSQRADGQHTAIQHTLRSTSSSMLLQAWTSCSTSLTCSAAGTPTVCST